MDLSCCGVLQEHHPGPIFPNLQNLQIHDWGAACYAPMFIQPTLLSLTFRPEQTEHLITMLDCVVANAPNLEYLDLSDNEVSFNEIEVELNRTICPLKSLVWLQFSCLPFSSHTLIHLSSLPHFNSLYLCLDQRNCHASVSPNWGKFSSLLALKVRYQLENAIPCLLSSIRCIHPSPT